jgi:transposase
MGTTGKPSGKKLKSRGRSAPPYPSEFRLKVARLHEEDGCPASMIAEQFGISEYSVYSWTKRYRLYGQQVLMKQPG